MKSRGSSVLTSPPTALCYCWFVLIHLFCVMSSPSCQHPSKLKIELKGKKIESSKIYKILAIIIVSFICWVQCSWATQILLVQGNITLWIVTVECFIIHIHYFVIGLLGRKSWAWVGRMNIVSPHTIIIPQYLTKSVLHKKASCNNALIAPLFYMLTFQRNMKNIKIHRQLHDHSQNEAKERIYTCFTMFLISLFAACKSWGFLLCSNFARSYQKRILTSGTIMIQSCLISIPVHM